MQLIHIIFYFLNERALLILPSFHHELPAVFHVDAALQGLALRHAVALQVVSMAIGASCRYSLDEGDALFHEVLHAEDARARFIARRELTHAVSRGENEREPVACNIQQSGQVANALYPNVGTHVLAARHIVPQLHYAELLARHIHILFIQKLIGGTVVLDEVAIMKIEIEVVNNGIGPITDEINLPVVLPDGGPIGCLAIVLEEQIFYAVPLMTVSPRITKETYPFPSCWPSDSFVYRHSFPSTTSGR